MFKKPENNSDPRGAGFREGKEIVLLLVVIFWFFQGWLLFKKKKKKV